ncbi:MAG: VOC family protein [Burkholderiaceae bacterium]|jgi:PhnB protein|nr:VOC family protein [Burkholderiaceae bacterium]
MRVEPYLMFAGRCDEALAFYQQAIGAMPVMVMRFRESPDPPPMPLPPGWDDKVMHCGFRVGDTLVMASDGMSTETPSYAGVTLSLTADSEAQARRQFAALAEGGSVFMPMGPTFWSACFGMCSDRFGVQWMVGIDDAVS